MKKTKEEWRSLGKIQAFDQQTEKLFVIDLDDERALRPMDDDKAWLRKLARGYSYWVTLRETAKEALATAKENEVRVESETYLRLREQLRERVKESEIKETELKHRVNGDAKTQAAVDLRLAREAIYSRICGVLERFVEIRTSLQSVVKAYSAELEANIGDQ